MSERPPAPGPGLDPNFVPAPPAEHARQAVPQGGPTTADVNAMAPPQPTLEAEQPGTTAQAEQQQDEDPPLGFDKDGYRVAPPKEVARPTPITARSKAERFLGKRVMSSLIDAGPFGIFTDKKRASGETGGPRTKYADPTQAELDRVAEVNRSRQAGYQQHRAQAEELKKEREARAAAIEATARLRAAAMEERRQQRQGRRQEDDQTDIEDDTDTAPEPQLEDTHPVTLAEMLAATRQAPISGFASGRIIERALQVSPAQAERILEALQAEGVIGPATDTGVHQVLLKQNEADHKLADLKESGRFPEPRDSETGARTTSPTKTERATSTSQPRKQTSATPRTTSRVTPMINLPPVPGVAPDTARQEQRAPLSPAKIKSLNEEVHKRATDEAHARKDARPGTRKLPKEEFAEIQKQARLAVIRERLGALSVESVAQVEQAMFNARRQEQQQRQQGR